MAWGEIEVTPEEAKALEGSFDEMYDRTLRGISALAASNVLLGGLKLAGLAIPASPWSLGASAGFLAVMMARGEIDINREGIRIGDATLPWYDSEWWNTLPEGLKFGDKVIPWHDSELWKGMNVDSGELQMPEI